MFCRVQRRRPPLRQHERAPTTTDPVGAGREACAACALPPLGETCCLGSPEDGSKCFIYGGARRKSVRDLRIQPDDVRACGKARRILAAYKAPWEVGTLVLATQFAAPG